MRVRTGAVLAGAFAAFGAACDAFGTSEVASGDGGTGPDAASSSDAGAAEATSPDAPIGDAAGCLSRAAKFDGASYFTATDAQGLDPSALTVEAWIFVPTSAPATTMHIVSHRNADGSDGWALALEANANQLNLVFYSYAGDAGQQFLNSAGSGQGVVPRNRWAHVAVTRNGTDVSLWVDKTAGPVSSTIALGGSTGRNVRIGTNSNTNGSTDAFYGLIEEVRISKVVRDIQATQRQSMVVDVNTLALWTFDEETGNAKDSAGTARTATQSGPIPRVCMSKFADDSVTP